MSFKQRFEDEKIQHDLYVIDFQIAVSVSFIFNLNFSIIVIFQVPKTDLKNFIFEILFIGDHIVQPIYVFDNKF